MNALVERSSCYLKIGKNDLALADAEESLKENREFTKVNIFDLIFKLKKHLIELQLINLRVYM